MIPALDSLSFTVIILWIIIVGCYLIGGLLFIRQSFKYAEEPRVKILSLVGLCLILAAISRLFHPVLFIFGDSDPFFSYISNGIFIAAVIMLMFYLERVIYPPSHYIFTIILVIGEIVYVITEIFHNYGVDLIAPEILGLIVPIVIIFAGLFMAVLYIKIAIQSSGEARKDAIYIIIGGVLFAGSYLLSGLEGVVFALVTGLEGMNLYLAVSAVILGFLALPFMLKGFRLSL